MQACPALLRCVLFLIGLGLCGLVAADPAQPGNPGNSSWTPEQIRYIHPADGNNSNSGTSSAQAWRTLEYAASQAQPGQLIYLHGGDYRPPNLGTKNIAMPSGQADAYITFRAFPGEQPTVWVDAQNGLEFFNSSYVELDGLEVRGPDTPTLCAGISIVGHIGSHHIRIRNCIVHHCGHWGIGVGFSDMILIEGNRVYRCAHHSTADTSGITVIFPKPQGGDRSGVYGYVIRNNICYDNLNTPGMGVGTDGNGIILDVFFRDADNKLDPDSYDRRTLVTGNVCFDNGGRGIHAFGYFKADIVNNTLWRNLKQLESFPFEGEMGATGDSQDIVFRNNIIVPRANRPAVNIWQPEGSNYNMVVEDNIRFGGATAFGWPMGPGDLNVDPKLVAPSADFATANWRIAADSPARDSGNADLNAFLVTDFEGDPRVQGAGIDRGADEYQEDMPRRDVSFEQIPNYQWLLAPDLVGEDAAGRTNFTDLTREAEARFLLVDPNG